MQVVEINRLDQLEPHLGAWRSLVASSPRAELFDTAEWVSTWLESFAADESLAIYLFYEDATGFALEGDSPFGADGALSGFGWQNVLVFNIGAEYAVSDKFALRAGYNHGDAAVTDDEWERAWNATMNVNLKALTLLCRLAIRHFRSSGGGRIINISSRLG